MATATATKEYNIPENYSQILDKVQNMLMSKVDTVKYTPQSASALKSAIAKALRPQYDAAIRNRQSTAAANRASIDADAAARGLGSSSWVTDVKNRQNNATAKDVANLEGQYSAALYQNLMNKLSEQDQLSLSAQQANAGIQQNALSTALGLTDKYYKEWAPDSSGSSGGSGSSRRRSPGSGGDNNDGLGGFGDGVGSNSDDENWVKIGNAYYTPKAASEYLSTKPNLNAPSGRDIVNAYLQKKTPTGSTKKVRQTK